jgi:hypothetical protein
MNSSDPCGLRGQRQVTTMRGGRRQAPARRHPAGAPSSTGGGISDSLAAVIARDDAAIERLGLFAPLAVPHRPEVALWLRETHCAAVEHAPPLARSPP